MGVRRPPRWTRTLLAAGFFNKRMKLVGARQLQLALEANQCSFLDRRAELLRILKRMEMRCDGEVGWYPLDKAIPRMVAVGC